MIVIKKKSKLNYEKILKKIFAYFGYEINKSNLNSIHINPMEFLPIKDNHDNF